MDTNSLKNHLESAAISFVTVFLISLAAAFKAAAFTPETFTAAAAAGIVFAAIQAAVRGLWGGGVVVYASMTKPTALKAGAKKPTKKRK